MSTAADVVRSCAAVTTGVVSNSRFDFGQNSSNSKKEAEMRNQWSISSMSSALPTFSFYTTTTVAGQNIVGNDGAHIALLVQMCAHSLHCNASKSPDCA